MEEKQNKKHSSLLVLLVFALVIVVCFQTFYTFMLHRKVDKLIGPTTSVSITPSLLPNPPVLRSPGWFGGNVLDPNSFLVNPFSEMKQLQQQMNQMFNDSFFHLKSGTHSELSPMLSGMAIAPRFDIDDEGDRFIVKLDMPGVDKSNINIELKDRTLTISANRNESVNEKDAEGKVLRHERYSGNFQRSITLPSDVKADAIQAKYENGVLTITIPKDQQQKQQSHKIGID